jgi:hypothetical protein
MARLETKVNDQPENSRKKKTKRGGSGFMTEACLKGPFRVNGVERESHKSERPEVPKHTPDSPTDIPMWWEDPASAEFSHLTGTDPPHR